jgi:hypothetical protein
MITPASIFTVFMLTLGPVRTVPAFFAMTRDAAPTAMRALALKARRWRRPFRSSLPW